MASFIDLDQLGVRSGYLGYRTYQNLKGMDRDLLWVNQFDIDIPIPPRVVAWPGLDIIKYRLKSMTVDVTKEAADTVDINIRGFKIHQSGGYISGGTINMVFIDFEDQFIYRLLQDFLFAIGANRYKFMFRKEDYMIPILDVYILNAPNRPVRKYRFYALIFTGGDYNLDLNTEPGSGTRDEITINFNYQHYEVSILNATPEIVY